MRNESKILLLCDVGHFYSHFYMLMFPSVALWIQHDFALSLPETLNLGFAMYLLFGLLALPVGALGDRWSNHRLLSGMVVGLGVGAIVCASSPGPETMLVGLAIIGVAAAIYHPVGMGLLSRCCASRGKALGHNGIYGNLGIGLAPMISGATAFLWGWRASFAISGALAIAIGVGLLRLRIDETALAVHEDPPTPAGQATDRSRAGLYFVIMLACMTLLGLCYRGTSVTLPAHFLDRIPFADWLSAILPAELAGSRQSLGATLLVSATYLVAIVGQMLGGHLSDRVDLRAAYFLFHLITLPLMWLMSQLGGIPLLATSSAYLIFALGMQPIENSLVARLTPNRFRSLAYGLKFIVAFGIGSLAVKLVRWTMENESTAAVFRWQCLPIVLVLALTLVLAYLSRRESFRNHATSLASA